MKELEFYFKETGEVIEEPSDYYFVMNNEVYRDNNFETESHAAMLSFEDFIVKTPNVDWRIKS